MSSTAVPPGTCVSHGYHGLSVCPYCSTSALPGKPISPHPDPSRPTPDQLAENLRQSLRSNYGWTPAPGSEIAELIEALLALAKRGEAYDEALIHAHNLYSQPTIRHGHVPVEAFAACMAELEQVTEERDGWRREVLVVNGQLEQGWKAKADAAEAERDRLAAALERIAQLDLPSRARPIAREALAQASQEQTP